MDASRRTMVVARWVLLAILTGSSVLRAQQTPESFQAFSTCVLPPLSPQADPWPVATTDVLGTMNSASVTFSGATLLANDRGTSLAVVSVGPSSSAGGAITGADPFTFTVSPGFQGEDIFSYEIRDGSGQTAVGLVKVSAVGDAVLPTVSLTAPVGGATVAGSVVVSASATDNIGIASVRFFDGSTQIGPQVTGAPFQVTWNTTGVPNGTHNLTAVARDPAGNTSTSAIVAVTVSNAAPVDPGGAGPVLALNFDSVTGDIVSDASGFNNHGTVRGATSQAGKIGKALKFDGVDDWVTVADAASLDLTSAMTLEAWVNPSTLTQWHTVLLKESAAGMAYELYAHNPDISRPAAYGTLNGALRGVTGTAALPTNTWTHLATTYDGTNMQLYVNGALVRSVARAGVMDATTGPLRIGGNVPWGGEFFAGLIDEVRVYNRALTASEIAADMNRGGTPPPPPPPPAPTPAGPVLALGFNEAAGSPIAHDSSGSGRDGSIREAQIVPGKFGNALSFDGVNDWVTVADAAALDLTSAMTLEAWVRPSEIAGWRTVLMKESPDSAAYELYANEETDRPSAYFVAGTTFKGVTGTAALATAAWTHLATTYDGANMRLYVNGVLARTVARTGAINTTAAPLRVGGNNAWGEFFSGLIDEVRVYNRALSQSEIQADMNTPLQ